MRRFACATIRAMRIRLLAFATAAQALGSGVTERELPDGATVDGLRRQLAGESAALAACLERSALAVDGVLVSPDTVLTPGCEVALLPPVSGG